MGSTGNAHRGRDDMCYELNDLAKMFGTSGPGEVLVREVQLRFLQRLVEGVQDLLARHAPDAHGRCIVCGKKRPCPVEDLIPAYVSRWIASGAPVPPPTSASIPVNVADPQRWRGPRPSIRPASGGR